MKILNVKQLAEILNVKPKTIYDWKHKGKIPYLKFGRLLRFDYDEIVKWVKNPRSSKLSKGYVV